MASISNGANGTRTIQFKGLDGKRKTIRMGKHSKKVVEAVKVRIEHLLSLAGARMPLDVDSANWIDGISDELAEKLAAAGVIDARQSKTLAGFLDSFIASRVADGVKPTTVSNYRKAEKCLIEFFGEARSLRTIGMAEAGEFKTAVQTPKRGRATVYTIVRIARTFFKQARKLKLVTDNPFDEVRVQDTSSPHRRSYVPAETIEKVIAVANGHWKTIIALARYAGLRNPSEVLSLRWADVNFETGRVVITSPKTEQYEGREQRVIPLFAALRPHMLAAREMAECEYVVGGSTGDTFRRRSNAENGWKNVNMRETMFKIIDRAGVNRWPRLFNNLRASCETDLMQDHPIQVVTAWLGNTPKVAIRHYLQTLDRDFDKATGALHGPTKQAMEMQRAELNHATDVQYNGSIIQGDSTVGQMVHTEQLSPPGVEPSAHVVETILKFPNRAARSDAAAEGTAMKQLERNDMRLALHRLVDAAADAALPAVYDAVLAVVTKARAA